MKRIVLTDFEGEPVMINPDMITQVRTVARSTHGVKSMVSVLEQDRPIEVRQSVYEIDALIAKTEEP